MDNDKGIEAHLNAIKSAVHRLVAKDEEVDLDGIATTLEKYAKQLRGEPEPDESDPEDE